MQNQYKIEVRMMKQILCFGDSNTYGYIPETKGRYAFEERWTGILAKALDKQGYRVIEEGLCGRTTVFEDELRIGRRGADLLPVLLESHKPLDRVVLMLGTNDCKTVYGASAEVIGRGIEKLIKQVRAIDPETKILLVSPIWLGEGVWEEGFDPEFNEKSVETSKKLKQIYQKIAKEYGCDFLAASDYVGPSEADREHLSKKSHKILAEAIYGVLAQAS